MESICNDVEYRCLRVCNHLLSEEDKDMFDHVVSFLFSRDYCIQLFKHLPDWNVFKPGKKLQELITPI